MNTSSCVRRLAAAAASIVLLAGCAAPAPSQPTAAPGGASAAAGQPVTLRWFMWAGNPEEQANWTALTKLVHEKYPNITVNLETDTLGNYYTKLQTQLASDSAPDIISMQSQTLPSFAVRNIMEPLDPFLQTDSTVKVDDYAKVMIESLSFNGKQYGLPYDLGPQVLYYNKELFDKKGIKYPDETLTWQSMLDIAQKLTYEEGGKKYYGYAAPGGFAPLLPWIFSNGAAYMDDAGATSRLDTPEFRETLQYYSDLIHKYKISPPISDPANDRKAVDDFYAGTVAMMNSGPWDFINARTRAKFEWDVTRMPQGKAGSVSQVQGSGFTVSAKSKYKQEAYKALTVITSTEGLSVLAKSGRAFPARVSAVPAFYDTTRPPANARIIEKASSNVLRYRVTPTWFDVLPLMNKEIDNVLIGQKTVDQFVKEVNGPFQDLLTKGLQLSK